MVLEQCQLHFPGIAPWATWCYTQPSNLLCAGRAIPSESGVQQGDPLGPLLFALALQPVLGDLASLRTPGGLQLVFSYLDDLCLAGEQSAVSAALAHLYAAAPELKLKLNDAKCEVIPAAGPHNTVDRSLFPSNFAFQRDGNFELLGAPVGAPGFCNAHTQERVDKASKVLAALGELPDPQVALLLLRQCACFGKLVYSLRLVPPRAHDTALCNFDQAVRECFESFTCASLGDHEWTVATLSTSQCGIGLRSTSKHSVAAFLSSRAGCHKLCCKLDPDHVWEAADPSSEVGQALTSFNGNVSGVSRIPPSFSEAPSQRLLSQALDDHTLECLKANLAQEVDHLAHLQLTGAANAGKWLHALPSLATHNKVEPILFKTMLQRWLRAPIFPDEFTCPECGGVVDVYGDHALVCSNGGDRTKRHNMIRNCTYHCCASAGLAPELEKPGLLQPRPLQGALPEDGIKRDRPEARRPADIFLPRWRNGSAVALDFAVTSGLRPSTIRGTLHDASAAACNYEDFKNRHLDTKRTCIDEGFEFIPMVAEAVGGGWGPAAAKVFYNLAKAKSAISGETKNTILHQLHQNLGILLHRCNARSVLRRCAPQNYDHHYILSAAATLDAEPGSD